MELFNLLAKLTLDKTEFDKGLDEAQHDADAFSPPDDQTLELDTSDYTSGLDDAESESELFSDSVGSIFTNLKGVLVGLGIVGLVTGIVGQLKEGVELAKNHGDQIDKQSQKMGISAKAYQEWAYALNLSGASIDDLNRGLRTWQQAVGDDDAVGKLSAAFAALGIDADEAFKKLEKGENLDALLDQVMYGLADKSAGDRGWIAEALFGKNATQLNALFNQTSKEIKNAKQEASDLGMVMTDEEVKNAAAYMDATTRLEGAMNGIKEAFAGSILPLLTDATNKLAEFIAIFNPRNRSSDIFATLEEISNKSMLASTKVDEASVTAKKLIEDLQSMGDYWSLDEEGRMTWDALADKALDLFPKLSDYIDKDGKKIKGNTEEIERNIDAWARLEKQRILSNAMAEKQEAVAAQLSKAYEKGAEARAKEAEAEGKRQTAMKKLNDELKAAGMGLLSPNATEGQMSTSVTNLMDYYGDDDAAQARIGLILKEWGETKTEAGKLRAEAERLKEEANNAQAALADQQRYLMEEMGLTQESIIQTGNEVDAYIRKLNSIPRNVVTVLDVEEADWHPHAIGGTIPYDNYPALLHRGEKVLTATEVRRGEGGGADYSAMEDRIVAAINKGMANATVKSYLNGKDITDDVNRRNMEGIKGRRFAT